MGNDALYVEIYHAILKSIQANEYQENFPLPSERYLCEKYHVSRSTIRQALNLLQESGVVYTVHGNGSFIKPRIYNQPLGSFYSFTDTLKQNNILIKNEIVGYELMPCTASLARKIACPAGTMFHKLTRLRSAKEYPLMIENTYLPQNRFIKLDIDALSHGSLYEYLAKKYDFHVDNATETFQAVMPRADERTLLNISATTPCILLERFSYEDECLIEYTKSIVRGDKYSFSVSF